MKYYRYKEILWTEQRISLLLIEFEVLGFTPRGVWIEEYPGKRRLVLNDSRKKFACPNKEQALESFRARKRRQIAILKAQLSRAKAALEAHPDNISIYFDLETT